MTFPGSNSPTMMRPSDSEMIEANMNQPSAFPPIRPTVRMSSIFAIPTTRVAKTSGEMIILMRRRKAPGRSAMPSENAALLSGNAEWLR